MAFALVITGVLFVLDTDSLKRQAVKVAQDASRTWR
jgi:hypothetical protein